MNDQLQSVLTGLDDKFNQSIVEKTVDRGVTIVRVEPASVYPVLEHLKNQARYDFLSDITALDLSGLAGTIAGAGTAGFEVVYQLYSTTANIRLRVKCRVKPGEPIQSVSGLWKAALCLEREVYDMFGIMFTGHPQLDRILLPDNFEHFPLRKDYPVAGLGERDRFPRIDRVE